MPSCGIYRDSGKMQIGLFYKTETERLSSFDFPVDPALPHGPTPSVNFRKVFGSLVRDRIFAIWTFSLNIWQNVPLRCVATDIRLCMLL